MTNSDDYIHHKHNAMCELKTKEASLSAFTWPVLWPHLHLMAGTSPPLHDAAEDHSATAMAGGRSATGIRTENC